MRNSSFASSTALASGEASTGSSGTGEGVTTFNGAGGRFTKSGSSRANVPNNELEEAFQRIDRIDPIFIFSQANTNHRSLQTPRTPLAPMTRSSTVYANYAARKGQIIFAFG